MEVFVNIKFLCILFVKCFKQFNSCVINTCFYYMQRMKGQHIVVQAIKGCLYKTLNNESSYTRENSWEELVREFTF